MNIKVETNDIRIDVYLKDKLDISRSKIQKLIENNKILVNNSKPKINYKVKYNDLITIEDDLSFDIDITPQNIPLNIVYEDDDLLVINKQSGMVVHPAPGNYKDTLVNALLGKFELSNDKIRPGIVHRIDKDTSGLMLVAKNDYTHDKLANMIKNKEVKRTYIAIVEGLINHDTGTIDAPIGRDVNNRQKMAVTSVNSKDAITHFKVLKRYTNNTLIQCNLETGRTHQIRVHMNYINHPIVNDPVYGKKGKTTSYGQYLHSWKIDFTHPKTGKNLHFETDIPIEFTNYLQTLN